MKRMLKNLICICLLVGALSMIIPSNNSLADQWSERYTVTYNTNDGQGVQQRDTKIEDKALLVADIQTEHEGFEFIGWSKRRTSKHADFPIGSYYNENKSVTLYAIWKKVGYGSLEYVKPKRKLSVKNQTFKYGKAIKIKTKTTPKGELKFVSKNKGILKFTKSGKGKALRCGKVKVKVIAIEDGLYKKAVKTITVTIKR